MAVVRAMGEAAQKTGNAVLLDTYAQKTAQRLSVNVESVRTEFRKARLNAAPAREEASEPPIEESAEPEALPRPSGTELWLLKLLLLAPEHAHFAADHLDPAWITHPTVRRIAAVHFSMGTDVAGLISQFAGDDFARSLISESASEQRAIPEPEKQLADVILRLRNAAHDATMASLSSTLADASLPDQERLAALSEQNRLRSEKRKPLHPLGDA
jgi:hypothetical protein